MPVPSLERQLASISNLVQDGEYYSAHQKYRTSAARLLKNLDDEKKCNDAADLLFDGARRLLEKGQAGSGVDLSRYLVKSWAERGVKCGKDERAKIQQLIALTGPSEQWRKSLIDETVHWTSQTGPSPAGDEAILLYVGELLLKEHQLPAAERHLLACPTRDAARRLAEVYMEWWKTGTGSSGKIGDEREVGRYAAKGVFSYLQNRAILAARTFLSHFLSLLITSHPSLLHSRIPIPNSDDELLVMTIPSLNLVQLALKDCQVGIGENKVAPTSGSGRGLGRAAWQALLGRYEREIGWLKIPPVKAATTNLSSLYFNIQPAGGAGGNMLADLMSNLFGGGGGGGLPALGGGAPSRGSGGQGRISSPGLD